MALTSHSPPASPIPGAAAMHPIRNAIFIVSALIIAGYGPHASSRQSSHIPSRAFSQKSSPASPANGWTLETHVNQMTDKKTIFATDTSTGSSSDYIARFPATLLLACPGAGQKAQMFTPDIAPMFGIKGDSGGNGYPVNIRLDKNRPFKWRLAYSNRAQGYFFDEPAEFLRKASRSTRMLIEYTQGGSQNSKVIVAFDMSGLSEALNKMHCNW